MAKCPYGNERCLCQSCADSFLNCGESHCIQCVECDTAGECRHDLYLCTGYREEKGE